MLELLRPSFRAAAEVDAAEQEAAWLQAKLLDAALQPIIAVDLERVVVYWNRAAEEMFGWSGAEAIGRSSPDLISRTETPEQRHAIVEAMRSGESWSGDYDVRRRDGRSVSVYVTNTPVLDREGSLVAVIAVAVDRTDRKTAEHARRERAAIVDGSGEAIFGTTSDGIVTSWNRAAERLFGYTADEIVGRSAGLIAPTDRKHEQVDMRDRLINGGAYEQLETVRVRKDGQPVDVRVTASTTTDEAGHVTGLSVIAHDITARREAQRRLEASERRLADAQRTAHIGDFAFDIATDRLTWSPEVYRILGLGPDTVVSPELFDSMIHPDDLAGAHRAWARAARQGRPFDLELRVVDTTSTQRGLRIRAVPVCGSDGTVMSIAGTIMDDTDKIVADEVRRTAEARFEAGFQQSGIGAAIVDLDGIPVRVNAAACSFLGRAEDELVGRTWTEFTHPDETPLGQIVLARMASGHDDYEDERRYLRSDGAVVWAHTHVTLVRDVAGEPQYLSAQFQDVTARTQMEHELSHLALHDALTGLPNRALLLDRLARGLAHQRPEGKHVAVISINLDRFAAVNDAHGHTFGDAMLSLVAGRITEAIRPEDTVARCDGDDFVVMADGVTVIEADQLAQRVLTHVGRPSRCNGEDLDITASLGVTVADASATPETLLRDSNVAMRRAKERGRGRVEIFDDALRRASEQGLRMAAALREGFARHEFEVHYQPVVDLATGAMASAEALVRWNRPGVGLVDPGDFVPLAESTGLIVPLGAWVLEQACRQVIEWQAVDPSMSVAVNVSVRQLTSPHFVGQVEDVLERTGIRPESLCLELTESLLMEDVGYFASVLEQLKALGVRLAIDDFGTGYSSLSYLGSFPADAVKVDRTFVDGLGTDPHSSAIVAAIVAMASALGLDVTAEGVETAEQLARLQTLEVQYAQGYFFARPMPAIDILRLVTGRHRWNTDLPLPILIRP